MYYILISNLFKFELHDFGFINVETGCALCAEFLHLHKMVENVLCSVHLVSEFGIDCSRSFGYTQSAVPSALRMDKHVRDVTFSTKSGSNLIMQCSAVQLNYGTVFRDNHHSLYYVHSILVLCA
ncbi:hypothetical protein T4D_4572 [Trichinella pseudospiralis]|uniref:Uncharacterized protein n=1 Tax=Trichinella pseudospiralis TaxID=6337 RepID=A0A0V1FAI3_TRIPS|nr:hypothetical protein T4D_4572 [Trichinella pseudospiralis]